MYIYAPYTLFCPPLGFLPRNLERELFCFGFSWAYRLWHSPCILDLAGEVQLFQPASAVSPSLLNLALSRTCLIFIDVSSVIVPRFRVKLNGCGLESGPNAGKSSASAGLSVECQTVGTAQ